MRVVVATEVSHKDVVIAIAGASAALGGFVLVFLGLVVANFQSYPGDVSEAVKDRIRAAGWRLFSVFAFGTGVLALAALWLIIPGGHCLFWITVAAFAAELLAIVVVTGHTTHQLVR